MHPVGPGPVDDGHPVFWCVARFVHRHGDDGRWRDEGLGNMAEMMAGMGNMDPAELLKNMGDLQNNPLLQGLSNANPELAQMLSNPEALAEQMIPFATLLLTEPDTRAPGELSGDERGGLTAYECVLQELVPLLTSILGSGPQELSGAAATNNLPLPTPAPPTDPLASGKLVGLSP